MLGLVLGLPLLAGMVALLVLLVRRIRATGRVTVGERIPLLHPAAVADPLLRAALEAVRGGRVHATGLGRYVLVLRRTPPWVIVPVWLTMPLGLLLLLAIKEDVVMDVALYDGPEGAVLELGGRSEKHVLLQLRSAMSAPAWG